MTGQSSELVDSDMLEYLDTVDGDSDFILESNPDDTRGAGGGEGDPHVTTAKRMTWMMMTTGKFYYLSSLCLFLSNSRNCLDLRMFLLLSLLPLFPVFTYSGSRSRKRRTT